jgi:hypothetical protein
MNKVFLTMIVFLAANITFAQSDYQDVVFLKNGSIIRGIISEQVPGELLKIETADGNLFVFRIDEVEKMEKERIATSKPAAKLNYDYVGGCKWYFSFGGSSNIVGDVPFTFGKYEFGYYISPQSLLSFEIGYGRYTEKEIGTFDWYEPFSDGRTIYHLDGKINSDYTISTFFASWSYIKDLSDRFQWRIGPTSGLLMMSGGFAFDPSGLKGEPDRQFTSELAFAFGANTGIMWNFSTKKRWFLDLGWKLYGNTGISFEEREVYDVTVDKKDFPYVGNQINLSIGRRFSKVKNCD